MDNQFDAVVVGVGLVGLLLAIEPAPIPCAASQSRRVPRC